MRGEYFLFDFIEPDEKVLLSLTSEGKSAIEEYRRTFNAECRANIALAIAFLALFKPASIDLFEFMKRLVLSLLQIMQS